MSKSIFNFDFGSSAGNSGVSMSMYGLAVKNRTGKWVSYDSTTKNIVDVDILNFPNMNKYIYKMPVAQKDISAGDIVVHLGRPVFVNKVLETGSLLVVDVYDGEEKIILPAQSPFGFNFYTKIVSLLNFGANTASADTPFGNMWMLAFAEDGNIPREQCCAVHRSCSAKSDLISCCPSPCLCLFSKK